jgi:hypothetical protein
MDFVEKGRKNEREREREREREVIKKRKSRGPKALKPLK